MSRFGRLVCLNGPRAGTEYDLKRDVTLVGRGADCDVALEDQYSSRHHAEVRRVNNGYQVNDLQSKNGVYVDGERLPLGGAAWLSDGAEVQFASTRFRFHDPSATMTALLLGEVMVLPPSFMPDAISESALPVRSGLP